MPDHQRAMRRPSNAISRLLPGLVIATLAACGGGGGADSPGAPLSPPSGAGSTALTVTGGVGPASAAPGSSVELWATVQPASEVVTQWVGAPLASDDEEWHVTLNVGSAPVNVTAQRQVLNIAFELLNYSAPTTRIKTARLHIPAAPRGLIVLLHGTGGSSAFIERTEARYLALKAISKGYAVLAPEAEEVAAGDLDGDGKVRWNVPLSTGNVDLRALDALIGSLVTTGRLSANLPRYAIGMSNGGSMAVALGAVGNTSGAASFPFLRFKAVISYCAQGRQDAVATTATPTAWHLCGNDDNADVSNATAQANSSALAARGVPSLALLHAATPLFDERFARVAGVTTAQSRAIASELRSAGNLDAGGLFIRSSAEIAALATASPGAYPTLAALLPAQQRDVISQIAVMRGEHEMFSDWASRALRWFASYPA